MLKHESQFPRRWRIQFGRNPADRSLAVRGADSRRVHPTDCESRRRARAKREELERLAQFSSWHAEELSRIKIAEAEARRERESLQWAAQISTRAEEMLRALQRQEAEERSLAACGRIL